MPPVSGRGLLIGANDGPADREIMVVPVGCQRLEHDISYAGMTPATETPMQCLPLVIAFRTIAPERSTHKYPFTNNRLSAPLRPGSAVFPKTGEAIRDHRDVQFVLLDPD